MSDEKKRDAESKRAPKEKQSLLSKLMAGLRPSTRDEKRAEEKKNSVEVKKTPPSVLLGQASPYFKLAVAAFEYIQDVVAKGSTEFINNQRTPEQLVAIAQGIADVRKTINQETKRRWQILLARGFPEKPELYDGLFMQVTIEIITKFSLANCGEISFLVADFCQQQGFKGPVSIYKIDNGNHQFAVIGEGEDALVCDPWANKIYPFTDYAPYLEGLDRRIRQTKQGIVADFKPVPYDAKIHGITKLFSMENLAQFRAESREYYRDLKVLGLRLQIAAKKEDLAEAMQFIEQGAMWTDSIYKDLPQLRKLLAEKLCEAVKENNVELVQQWLFRDGGLVNSVDGLGNSLLDLVILNQNTEMMKLLLDAGANLSASKIANELLIELAQPNSGKPDEKKATELSENRLKMSIWFLGCIESYEDNIAAAYNELMRKHIKLGDIDTALQIFSAFPEFNLAANYFVDYYFTSLKSGELYQAFRILVQRTDISEKAKDAIKMAAFYYALRHDSNMRDLILAVFSGDPYFINTKDKEGNTALHIAAREGNLKVIQFLLGSPNHALKYIDPSAENDVGATPYDVGTREAQALLQSFMQHGSIQQQQPGQLGQSFADIEQLGDKKEEKIRSRRASSPDKPQFEPPFVRSRADSADSIFHKDKDKDKKEKDHPVEQKHEASVSRSPTQPPPLEGSRASSSHNESHSEPPSPRSRVSSVDDWQVEDYPKDYKEDHQVWGDEAPTAPPPLSSPVSFNNNDDDYHKEWKREHPPAPPPSPVSPKSRADMPGSGSFWHSANHSKEDKKLEGREEEKNPKEEKQKTTRDSGQDKQPHAAPESNDPTNRNK